MRRNKIFVSYSYKDEDFLKAFRVHLKPLEDKGLLDIWSDHRIELSQEETGGIRLRRDSLVSVMYAEEPHSTTSSVTLQSTDRHEILVRQVVLKHNKIK